MKTIKETTQNKISAFSSKLAEHALLDEYGVSIDMLYDENGHYFPNWQKEFDLLFDEIYNELLNLLNKNQ